jgi:hypothetical protein
LQGVTAGRFPVFQTTGSQEGMGYPCAARMVVLCMLVNQKELRIMKVVTE